MKKIMDCIRECPLLLMIIVSALIFTGVAYVKVWLGEYDLNVTMEHPMLVSVLLDEKTATPTDAPNDENHSEDGNTEDSSSEDENTQDKNPSEKDTTEEASTEENSTENTETQSTETETEESTLGGGSAQVNAKIERPTQYKKVKKRASRNSCYGDVKKVALTTDYPYVKKKHDYFEDALFIGDSRVEGLALYSGIDNADFAYKEGLTVQGLMDEKIAHIDDAILTLPELLSSKQYKKIYIMLGVNELGYDTDYFVAEYMKKIEEIMDAQPDAIVFMMGCMYVSSKYSANDDIINNDNIDDKNNGIAAYANGIDLFYFDVNTALAGDDGGLKEEYTWDDIHLQAQYYELWENYLLEHGLNDNMWE